MFDLKVNPRVAAKLSSSDKRKAIIMKAIVLSVSIATGLFSASAVVAAESPAAELKRIQGSVLVNKGEAYRTAVEGMPLQRGDRVMIMDASSMTMVYSDGCIAEFKENQIITVEEVSTCEGGTAASVSKSPLYADPMGGGTGGAATGIFGLGPAATAGAFTVAGFSAAALAKSTDKMSGE